MGPTFLVVTKGVALGTCTSIDQLASDIESRVHGRLVSPNSWWVTKYHTQPRISLDGMNDPERRQLAEEFGIRVGREGPNTERSGTHQRFTRWWRDEERMFTAASFRDTNAYLPGWYEAARGGGGQ
jgi:hypothetical protein